MDQAGAKVDHPGKHARNAVDQSARLVDTYEGCALCAGFLVGAQLARPGRRNWLNLC